MSTKQADSVPDESINTSRDIEKASLEDSKDTTQGSNESEYPSTKALAVILLALYLALFLVALDRTIISVAIPSITDDFQSLGDVSWYGSAYMLTSCAFQLLLGRVYTFFSPKWVFIAVIIIFETGSAICGAATSSIVLIIGRAIAGLGSAGVFSGVVVITVHIIPLHKRPIYQSFMGAIFGISSVLGPLIGGAFTESVSWRWCFYINLPIGAVSIAVIALVLRIPDGAKKETRPFKQQVAQLDPVGTMLFLPAVVCLLLALQWGGSTYPWSDGRIITLLVLSAVLSLAWITVQVVLKDHATVPPKIIKQRSIAAGVWYATCSGGAMMVLVYYLPIWFQAVKDTSAVKSGIMIVPMVLALVIGSILAGGAVTRTGYYTPFMIGGCCLMSIGSGLLTTFETDTNHFKWIGYQVIYGLGTGLGMQQPNIAAQTVLEKKDVPTGVSLMFFAQSLGGSLFVSVAQNIFTTQLIGALPGGIDAASVVNSGATELTDVLGKDQLPLVLSAYNYGLKGAFEVATGAACATIIGALAMEWRSVKQGKNSH